MLIWLMLTVIVLLIIIGIVAMLGFMALGDRGAQILGKEEQIMKEIDDLKAQITALQADVTASRESERRLVTLTGEIKAQLDALSGSESLDEIKAGLADASAQLGQIDSDVQAQTAETEAAIAADSPAPAPADGGDGSDADAPVEG